MVSFSIAVLFFIKIDKTIDVFSCSDYGISFPGIKINDRTGRYILWDEWLKNIRFNAIDNLGPDSTVVTKDPEYWLFFGPSSSISALIPDRFWVIVSLTSKIYFIHFNGTGEDLRDIFGHHTSNIT